MASEQGFDSGPNRLNEGRFSRKAQGRKILDQLQNVGIAGRGFDNLDEAPADPEWGDVYGTDGTGWDPAGDGSGGLFAYDGADWVQVVTL